MKKYNRAQEKENSLTSVNMYTTFEIDDREGLQSEIHLGGRPKRTASDCDRKDDGEKWNKSGRGRSKDRGSQEQRQQNHAPKASSERRFSAKDGRKHWSRDRAKDQKTERLVDGIPAEFTPSSDL